MSDLAFEFLRHVSIGVFGGLIVLCLVGLNVTTQQRGPRLSQSSAQVFTFRNRRLISVSKSAEHGLSLEDLDDDVFEYLVERLSGIFPTLREKIESAERSGNGFRLSELSAEGPAEIICKQPSDGILEMSIEGIKAPMSRKILVDADRARSDEAELQILRGVAETTPVAIWQETASGQIDWVNRTYAKLIEQAGMTGAGPANEPPRLFKSSAVTKPGNTPSRRRSNLDMTNGETHWYEISSFGQGDSSLHFAVNVNATIRAEDNLRNLTQTLTQTFAYLPIGLAIFDRSRQLVMFNPALLDLTSLEPVWLSCRPTLYDFLNRLREKRMVPERRDFSDWRKKLEQLEQLAVKGSYCETWTLPTGQTYRVTGRPHPEGAIAFLIEDISSEISLTRKFRQELDLSQSLFDSFSDAIAIFSPSGVITMSNAAYATLWGLDPSRTLVEINLMDACKTWQTGCLPTPIWGDVRDYIVQKGDRSEWRSPVALKDGRQLTCRLAPLSGGATLVGFSVVAESHVPQQPETEISLMTG